MTPEQEKLLVLRVEQCLEAIDAHIKGQTIPQSLRDAVEALREAVPKPEKK